MAIKNDKFPFGAVQVGKFLCDMLWNAAKVLDDSVHDLR